MTYIPKRDKLNETSSSSVRVVEYSACCVGLMWGWLCSEGLRRGVAFVCWYVVVMECMSGRGWCVCGVEVVMKFRAGKT